jgi:conjugative transposon TraM protein
MKENDSKKQEKRELSPAELQKRRKMLVFPLFFLLFAGAMWCIFAPSTTDREQAEASTGFNAELPAPNSKGIIGDKRDAYEQEAARRKQEEKRRSLQDFAFMLAEEHQENGNEVSIRPVTVDDDYEATASRRSASPSWRNTPSASSTPSIHSSADAYHSVNSGISSWYDRTGTEPDKQEKIALQRRIEELEHQATEAQQQTAADRQLEMIEKSYQIAAKYMPAVQSQGLPAVDNTQSSAQAAAAPPGQKAKAQAVSSLRQNVVSLLAAPMEDAVFVQAYAQPRNAEFHTAVGDTQASGKNTISACIHKTLTLVDGQDVQLRLLEDIEAGGQRIPAGSLISGTVGMGGERLFITLTWLQYAGNIVPVELQVYDTDGLPGIFVPGSQEMSAVKEMAANMGTQMGTSISISNNAGSQLAADLGKGVIQGASQYLGRKFRTVRVTLKAGYRVLLLPPLQ